MILSIVGMILSNSSAKEKSIRFKATKGSKGNRNGGQRQTLPSPHPHPRLWPVWRRHPKLDRCSGSGTGSEAGRAEDAFVTGGISPFLPAHSVLQQGTQLRDQLPLCGGHRLHSQWQWLWQEDRMSSSLRDWPWGNLPSQNKQTKRSLAYWHCLCLLGGAPRTHAPEKFPLGLL